MKVPELGPLGEYLREQRRNAELSLRQLASLTGVSNPYLSQIERGLRRPSAEVLQQLARSLRISAEALYVRAGLLDPTDDGGSADDAVEVAILADPALTDRQRRVLLDIYAAFRRETLDHRASARVPSTDGASPTNQGSPTNQAQAGSPRAASTKE